MHPNVVGNPFLHGGVRPGQVANLAVRCGDRVTVGPFHQMGGRQHSVYGHRHRASVLGDLAGGPIGVQQRHRGLYVCTCHSDLKDAECDVHRSLRPRGTKENQLHVEVRLMGGDVAQCDLTGTGLGVRGGGGWLREQYDIRGECGASDRVRSGHGIGMATCTDGMDTV